MKRLKTLLMAMVMTLLLTAGMRTEAAEKKAITYQVLAAYTSSATMADGTGFTFNEGSLKVVGDTIEYLQLRRDGEFIKEGFGKVTKVEKMADKTYLLTGSFTLPDGSVYEDVEVYVSVYSAKKVEVKSSGKSSVTANSDANSSKNESNKPGEDNNPDEGNKPGEDNKPNEDNKPGGDQPPAENPENPGITDGQPEQPGGEQPPADNNPGNPGITDGQPEQPGEQPPADNNPGNNGVTNGQPT